MCRSRLVGDSQTWSPKIGARVERRGRRQSPAEPGAGAGEAPGLIEILASANGAGGAGISGEALGGLSNPTRSVATNRDVSRPFPKPVSRFGGGVSIA